MAHAQKPDFVFWRNGRFHLNRWGRQFSRLLAAEVCASAVVMLDILCSEVVWRVLDIHSIRQFPPSLPLPCVTVCHHFLTGLYLYPRSGVWVQRQELWAVWRGSAVAIEDCGSRLEVGSLGRHPHHPEHFLTWSHYITRRLLATRLRRAYFWYCSRLSLRFSLFWDVTQRRMVVTDVSDQPYRFHFQGRWSVTVIHVIKHHGSAKVSLSNGAKPKYQIYFFFPPRHWLWIIVFCGKFSDVLEYTVAFVFTWKSLTFVKTIEMTIQRTVVNPYHANVENMVSS
jgi:hypothetical protein